MNRDLIDDVYSLVFRPKSPRFHMDKESSVQEEGSQLEANKWTTRSKPGILLNGRTVKESLQFGS
jgi:hypothetical protein